ncbi:CDP-archaeol synthase [Acetobacteraceae bacterium]|nr:CDP-archaeol synthase [Acetobacteraceae bacterium]
MKKLFHSSAGWADLMPRLLSAIVLLMIAFITIWYGGWPYNLFVAVISFFIAFEALPLARGSKEMPFRGVKLYFSQFLALLIAAVGGIGFFLLRLAPSGLETVFFVFLIVAACDTGAYFSGRLIGGRKLAPSISPGKTISGAVGGLFFAMLIGMILVHAFTGHWVSDVAFYAFLIGISSQIGDLCESAAKRRSGVKDSGKIIPGHGGVLDRLDGMLGAIPVALILQLFAGTEPFWNVHLKYIF